MASTNYVAQLNLYMQKMRVDVRYEDVMATGADHIKQFVMRVVVNEVAYPDGEGKNKKEAKENAAKNAMERLLREPEVSRHNASETSVSSVENTPKRDCVSWLHMYGQEKRLFVNAIQSTRVETNNPEQFCCKYKVGDIEYPEATGMNKREAKHAAAQIAFDRLSSPQTKMSYETASRPSPQSMEDSLSQICSGTMNMSIASASEDESGLGFNYIGKLNEHCQRKKLQLKYNEEPRQGPPNNLRFFIRVVIGDQKYPLSEGGNLKEARQKAAQQAWNSISMNNQSVLESWTTSGVSSPSASSTPVRSGVTTEPKLPAQMSATGSSIVFEDTPATPQVKAPDVKPKRMLAPNFKNADKKDAIKERTDLRGKTSNEKKEVVSSFKSEYYSIVRIGKGAFGRVFKAREKLVVRDYAIKIVAYKDKKSLTEVKALSDLNHKNIVRYYCCWIEDSLYQSDILSENSSVSAENVASQYLYIKMELCADKTLRTWIDAQNVKNPLEDSTRRKNGLNLAQEIIEGVVYFHSKKLIHRDLKPSNIMFGVEGGVKIGDFGLVTDELDDDSENQRERATCKGTRSYMAPEQLRSYVCDRRADIFSLGLIYFELFWRIVTGHERKEMWPDVRSQKFPTEFSKSFRQESKIIKSMLSQTSDDRPEASQVKTLLKQLHDELEAEENLVQERRTR